jgi:fatty acid synthase, animal type
LQDVLNLFSGKEDFLLVGYSFGSILSIELAKVLENAGKKGSLMVIDGSPSFIHQMTNLIVPDRSDEKIRDFFIVTCIRLLFPNEFNEISKKVFSFSTWDEQLKCFGEYSAQKSKYSYDYGKKMLDALVKRMKMSLDLDKLELPVLSETPLRFVRATESSAKNIGDDYGLSKYSSQNIEINVVEGNHLSMLTNPKLSSVINSI